MNEQLKSILIWLGVILVIIGFGLLARYVLVIFPLPHVIDTTYTLQPGFP